MAIKTYQRDVIDEAMNSVCQEQVILKFKLPNIQDLETIFWICSLGYKKTGKKFSISFNGSKGYIDNIEISCEGVQLADNRVSLDGLINKNGTYKKKIVNIFHSKLKGVRVSIGKDNPFVYNYEPA